MNSAIGLIWDIARTLIVVGVIIFLHELGHFLAAKKLGIIVERFSIGFGPKLLGFIRGDTEYRISIFPIFGGYVKMKGEYLTDDKEEEGELEEGHFLNAPVSHRAIVAIAGPGMNVIFAVVAIALAYMVGMPSQLVPSKNTSVGYVEVDSPASRASIIPGDKIIAVAGYKAKTWSDIQENIAINPDKEVELTLLRNGQEISTKIIPERIEELILSIGTESQSSLDNGNLPEGMRQDFENNKVSLSPNAELLIKEPGGEWIIVDGNKKYRAKL